MKCSQPVTVASLSRVPMDSHYKVQHRLVLVGTHIAQTSLTP